MTSITDATELYDICARLAAVADTLAAGPPPMGEVSPELLRAIIGARRLRDRYFDASLFADPAWDMLLDLMLARLEGREVSVSSLCIAAAVPATTALRWISRLSREGLIERRPDDGDGRRSLITLSESTAQALEAYLRCVTVTGA